VECVPNQQQGSLRGQLTTDTLGDCCVKGYNRCPLVGGAHSDPLSPHVLRMIDEMDESSSTIYILFA